MKFESRALKTSFSRFVCLVKFGSETREFFAKYSVIVILGTMFLNCVKLMRHFCSKVDFKRSYATISKPILYGDEASPPVRFALMTALHLGIDVDFHKIDLFLGENKSEFYAKINPLQKVPALAVGKEIIKDSHAIAIYFCNLGGDSDFYPKNPLDRAKVDQMLFFNSSLLFPLDSEIYNSYFAGKPVSEDKIKSWNNLLDYLENKLAKNKWLAGEQMTVCDLCCAATITSLRLLLRPQDRHIHLNQWLRNMTSFSCFDINVKGLERLNIFVKRIKELQV